MCLKFARWQTDAADPIPFLKQKQLNNNSVTWSSKNTVISVDPESDSLKCIVKLGDCWIEIV